MMGALFGRGLLVGMQVMRAVTAMWRTGWEGDFEGGIREVCHWVGSMSSRRPVKRGGVCLFLVRAEAVLVAARLCLSAQSCVGFEAGNVV